MIFFLASETSGKCSFCSRRSRETKLRDCTKPTLKTCSSSTTHLTSTLPSLEDFTIKNKFIKHVTTEKARFWKTYSWTVWEVLSAVIFQNNGKKSIYYWKYDYMSIIEFGGEFLFSSFEDYFISVFREEYCILYFEDAILTCS